jgi:sigma-B regulation protein RsbU (phosphoserine phosphatase)
LRVVPPLHLRTVFLIPTIGSGTILLAALVVVTTALTKRRRQVHAYQQAAVRELQDAREMQMSLLPEAALPVEGMEIAGRSIPANTVGGDFFDYLALADGKVGVAIADVSGKGLRAAMNATMANGMMHTVANIEASCGSILSRLNTHLYPLMEKQMFTALSFAIVEQDTGVIQWSNAAQPLPLVKRSEGVSEAAEHGELPLGMAPDVKYPDHELKLQPGDTVIFYTDGIIEAENGAEEMYGTERLLNMVTGMDPAASAEDVVEDILQDVADFVGIAEQYDDMTVVVVKRDQGEGKRDAEMGGKPESE